MPRFKRFACTDEVIDRDLPRRIGSVRSQWYARIYCYKILQKYQILGTTEAMCRSDIA